MIPRAKDLRKLWFEWPESLYGRFNFQRDEHIDALLELLVGDGLPAVVVLGGEPGIGRGFLCDAAAQRARDQGHKVAVWHLDLDGFEPDIENPLTNYLRHLIDQEERHLEAARVKAKGAVKSAAKTLSTLGLVGQASEVAASLLSLLWQFEEPLTHLAEVLSRPPSGNSTPPRNDPDTLHRFLAELTRDRKLLVHVNDGSQLTSNLRRWLIRETERAPDRLLLVISCSLDQPTERAAPEARPTPERFDVQPLDAAELRNLLDRRFHPNEFPDDLVAVLMRRWHGRPAIIANQMADLMEAEFLLYENESWRLPPEGLEDGRLVDTFSRGLFEEVDKPLAALTDEEPELAQVLRDLLFLAALCGRHVPMAALLEHLQLDEATAEAAVDWVDDVLAGELGWLTDLGFHIAGFPGSNVYAFTHPLLPRVILDQKSEVAREMRAATLLRFLEQRVTVTRRSWARCFLSIAEHLGNRDREPYERSLAWWIGLEAADALQVEVRTAIKREEVDPELVWRVAEGSKAWPAYRRLAVLEAYAQATVGEGEAAIAVLPFDRFADFHMLRAELLNDVGRYAESLADALDALKLVSRNPLKRARSHNLAGLARIRLGDARAAESDLKTALALDRENLGEEHSNTLSVRNNLAVALSELGKLADARKLKEENLEIVGRVLGGEHPLTVTARHNLALTLMKLGDFVGARTLQEQSLEICERVFGNKHLSTLSARHNLAQTIQESGDFNGAQKLQEQNLEIYEQVLGNEHPDTLYARNSLASTLEALGDLATAIKLLEENLKIGGRVLGSEHPSTLTSRNNLAKCLSSLGDLTSARKHYEQILEIQERVQGSEHLGTLISKNNLAVTLANLGDLASARELEEEVLEIRQRMLGSEHPDSLVSKNNLAEILGALGDVAGSRKLEEEVLETRQRVLGSEHPDSLTSKNNLAETVQALGDLEGARKLFEHTLEIRERMLGGEHPDTTNSTWNLLLNVRQLNDLDAEAHLINKLRWLLDRDEDSIPSAIQRRIRQMLFDLLNSS